MCLVGCIAFKTSKYNPSLYLFDDPLHSVMQNEQGRPWLFNDKSAMECHRCQCQKSHPAGIGAWTNLKGIRYRMKTRFNICCCFGGGNYGQGLPNIIMYVQVIFKKESIWDNSGQSLPLAGWHQPRKTLHPPAHVGCMGYVL